MWRIRGERSERGGVRAAEQLVALPERSTRKLRPGREVDAFMDPQDPAKATFF